MTGTFFPLMPPQTLEVSFNQIPNGSSETENNPPEEPSFFDLFQRHTSAMTTEKAMTVIATDLRDTTTINENSQ